MGNYNANCQNFKACSSSIGDNPASVGSDGSMTGNDVMDFSTSGTPPFYDVSTNNNSRVTGKYSGIAWRVDIGSSAGDAPFTGTTASIRYSDVCLVHDVTDAYAVAVYEDNSGSIYWETYKWISTAFVSQNVGNFSNSLGTTLHKGFNGGGVNNKIMFSDRATTSSFFNVPV